MTGFYYIKAKYCIYELYNCSVGIPKIEIQLALWYCTNKQKFIKLKKSTSRALIDFKIHFHLFNLFCSNYNCFPLPVLSSCCRLCFCCCS